MILKLNKGIPISTANDLTDDELDSVMDLIIRASEDGLFDLSKDKMLNEIVRRIASVLENREITDMDKFIQSIGSRMTECRTTKI